MDGNQQQQHGGQAHDRQLQSIAEVALRGTALFWDLQMETARNLWRTQARAAALLGIPDCSGLFNVGDDRARRLFTASAEQILDSARQARETVVEMQRQMGRLAEQQTIGITEEVRDQIEQVGRHTEQGLQEMRQMTASEADQAEARMQDVQNRRHEASRDRDGDASPNGGAEASFGAAGDASAASGPAARRTEEATRESGSANERAAQRKPRRHEERTRGRR
jgi:hypothetical protein